MCVFNHMSDMISYISCRWSLTSCLPTHLAHEGRDDAMELGGLETLAGSALGELEEVLPAHKSRSRRHQKLDTVMKMRAHLSACRERLTPSVKLMTSH